MAGNQTGNGHGLRDQWRPVEASVVTKGFHKDYDSEDVKTSWALERICVFIVLNPQKRIIFFLLALRVFINCFDSLAGKLV